MEATAMAFERMPVASGTNFSFLTELATNLGADRTGTMAAKQLGFR
jgi:hypothetical protein